MTADDDAVWRQALRQRNDAAWDAELEPPGPKYDSSMKKNTAFIRKVRTISADQAPSILRDIDALSLEKYLSEIIASLSEGLAKVARSDDIVAATEIVSRLHQRFGTSFSPELLTYFVAGLASPAKADDQEKTEARIGRQKNLLRLLTELYLVGVFRTVRDCPRDSLPDHVVKRLIKSSHDAIVVALLKDILNYDFKLGNSIPVVQVFLKRFHPLIFGETDGFDAETKKTLKQIFEIYSKALWQQLTALNSQRNSIMNQNRKSSIRTGKLFDENKEQYEAVNSIFEKFRTGAEFLAPIMNIPLPTLDDQKFEVDETGAFVAVVKTKSANEDDLKIWENSKDKTFYTVIPTPEELVAEYADSDKLHLKTFETDGEKVNDFIARFELMSDKQDVDLLVVEFNKLSLNNKATRNRLFKFFVEASQLDNLKFYGRFLRINQVQLKDLINELIEYLDKGFRSQMYNNTINFKNILFFTELIKFKLIPSHIIFHKIRTLTMRLSETNNIDILSIMYEKCGRFLLNDPDYGDLMGEMLKLLKERLKDKNLSIDEKFGIKNILFIINPPDTKINDLKINTRPELSPKEEFLVQLLRVGLNKKTYKYIIKTLVKFDFQQNLAAQAKFVEIISKPELVIYENLEYLANILVDISNLPGNSFLVPRVIDSLLEGIIRNLEVNDYKANRLRTNQIKLVAEFFNVELVNFKFIIDLCYKIICYGHPNNQPLPMNYDNPNDYPKNYFRIQLISLLLCSLKSIIIVPKPKPYQKKRNLKAIARLNQINTDTFKTFFVFFQYYTFCKVQPIPVEIGFKINDIYEKYSEYYEEGELERLSDLRSAVQNLQVIIQQKGLQPEEAEEEDVDDEEVDDNEESEAADVTSDLSDDEDDDDDDEDDDEEDDDSDDDDESDLAESSEEEEVDDDDEDEDDDDDETETEVEDLSTRDEFTRSIDREFQRMISESIDKTFTSNRNGRFSSQKVLPSPAQVASLRKQPQETTSDPKKLSFSLLTKKDKNPDIKQLNVSVDNKFAAGLLKERTAKQHNKEKLVNLILNMQDE